MGGSMQAEWDRMATHAAREGDAKTLSNFMSQFFDTESKAGMTPLMGLAHWGALDAVRAIIERDPKALLEVDGHGCDALMWAAWSCNPDCLLAILAKSERTDRADKGGWRALDFAAEHGELSQFAALLESKDADPLRLPFDTEPSPFLVALTLRHDLGMAKAAFERSMSLELPRLELLHEIAGQIEESMAHFEARERPGALIAWEQAKLDWLRLEIQTTAAAPTAPVRRSCL